MYHVAPVISTLHMLQDGGLLYVSYSQPSSWGVILTGRISVGVSGDPIALETAMRQLGDMPYMALLSFRLSAKIYTDNRLSGA